MSKFKIGDTVVGNNLADRYGWTGRVTILRDYGQFDAVVTGSLYSSEFGYLNEDCFDLVPATPLPVADASATIAAPTPPTVERSCELTEIALPDSAYRRLNRIAKHSGQTVDTVASVIIGSFLAQQPAKAKRKAAAK